MFVVTVLSAEKLRALLCHPRKEIAKCLISFKNFSRDFMISNCEIFMQFIIN